MSLLLLVDGYNVVAPIAPPSRGSGDQWLQRERMRLIQRLVKHLERDVRSRSCVVFDAANPPRDRPEQYSVEGLEIRFAVGYPEADDLLEEMIAAHSAPKQLAVISSDNRVQTAARRRGCAVFDSQSWLDDLLEGEVGLAKGRRAANRRAGKSERDRGPAEQGRVASEQGSGAANSAAHDSDDQADGVSEQEVERWMKEFGF